jgi:hypothetical protein
VGRHRSLSRRCVTAQGPLSPHWAHLILTPVLHSLFVYIFLRRLAGGGVRDLAAPAIAPALLTCGGVGGSVWAPADAIAGLTYPGAVTSCVRG